MYARERQTAKGSVWVILEGTIEVSHVGQNYQAVEFPRSFKRRPGDALGRREPAGCFYQRGNAFVEFSPDLLAGPGEFFLVGTGRLGLNVCVHNELLMKMGLSVNPTMVSLFVLNTSQQGFISHLSGQVVIQLAMDGGNGLALAEQFQ